MSDGKVGKFSHSHKQSSSFSRFPSNLLVLGERVNEPLESEGKSMKSNQTHFSICETISRRSEQSSEIVPLTLKCSHLLLAHNFQLEFPPRGPADNIHIVSDRDSVNTPKTTEK